MRKAVVIAVFLFTGLGLANLNLKLSVTEPSGVSRTNCPVSSGIPLPIGLVADENTLAVTDAGGAPVPCQFRVIERWGRDQSIKWVLCDFQATLSANQTKEFYLKDGSSPASGSITYTQDNDFITINTGAASFKIDRKSFNLFREVTVNSKNLITATSGTNSFITHDSGTFDMSDSTHNVSIEEDGNVRLVVRAKGKYSTALPCFFRYDIRLFFYAGHSYVRVQHVLKTVFEEEPLRLYDFRDMNLTADLNLTGSPVYTLATESANTYTVSTGDTLTLYQESEGGDGWDWMDADPWNRASHIKTKLSEWGIPSLVTFRGHKLFNGGSLVGTGDKPLGFCDISGSDGAGLMVHLQDFWVLHPKAIDMTGSKIIFRLYPKHYTVIKHFLEYRGQKTHDLFYYFHDNTVTAAEMAALGKAWNEPLAAYAGSDWYARSMGVEQYLGKATHTMPDPPYREFNKFESEQNSGVWRYRYGNIDFNSGGFHGQAAPTAQKWYYSGDYKHFLRLNQWGRNYRDLSVYFDDLHSTFETDPTDTTMVLLEEIRRHSLATVDWVNTVEHYHIYHYNSNNFPDLGHMGCYPAYENYYLTGEMRYLDLIRAFAEYRKVETYKSMGIYDGQTQRGHGWSIHILTLAWAFTGLESYKDYLNWDVYNSELPGHKKHFRWSEGAYVSWHAIKEEHRGLQYRSSSTMTNPARCASWMLSIEMNGLHKYYEASREEEVRDMIWGISQGYLNYVPYKRPDNPPSRDGNSGGLPSDVMPHMAEWDPSYGYSYHPRKLLPFCYAYLYTGDLRFKQRALEMWYDHYEVADDGKQEDEGYVQATLHLRDYPRADTIAPEAVSNLTAAPGGLGEVMLTFTTPNDNSGAIEEYIAKYDTFRIHDTVMATPQGLTANEIYMFWDSLKTAFHQFWMAHNTPLEPQPYPPGSSDTVYIHGLDTSKTYYFAMKTYDPSNNLSPISNVVTVKPGTSGPVHQPRPGIEDGSEVKPLEVSVCPNPFNPVTVISIKNIGPGRRAAIKIYSIKGELVHSKESNNIGRNNIEFFFNGSHLGSGLYVAKVMIGKRTLSRKMILIK